jgi:hypothetical protein
MRNFRAYHTFSREKGNCVTLRDAIGRLHDILRDLEDPDEIAFMGAKFIGETLGVSRAGYGTINKAEETITIERDWNAPGIKSLAGTLRFRDYGSYIEDLKVGRTVVFADAETDPRTRDRAPALKAISAQSAVNMPLTEQGGVVALLYLNHQTARPWSEEELVLSGKPPKESAPQYSGGGPNKNCAKRPKHFRSSIEPEPQSPQI